MTLDEIHNVWESPEEPGVYLVEVKYSDSSVVETFGARPDDNAGYGPTVQLWLENLREMEAGEPPTVLPSVQHPLPRMDRAAFRSQAETAAAIEETIAQQRAALLERIRAIDPSITDDPSFTFDDLKAVHAALKEEQTRSRRQSALARIRRQNP